MWKYFNQRVSIGKKIALQGSSLWYYQHLFIYLFFPIDLHFTNNSIFALKA